MRTEHYGGLTVRITGGTDRNGGGTGPLIVLLHGYGAPGTDLVGLWREVNVPSSVRFAFPEAPIALNLGFGEPGRAWWNIDMAALQRVSITRDYEALANNVPEGLVEAREQLSLHLELLKEQLQVPDAQLLLGGFSQGAMLSCELAFETPLPLAGLCVLSGTLIHRSAWQPHMAARKGLAVLQSHGRADPILPFALAERLRDDMLGAGLQVQFIPFNGGHGIGGSVLDGLQSLITRTLVKPVVGGA
ncbi:MAG: hypothetical protein SFV15_16700 [Polyangiaceae bacterium]|nr:hypothetical protein [Polyangiaceae bacterium]